MPERKKEMNDLILKINSACFKEEFKQSIGRRKKINMLF